MSGTSCAAHRAQRFGHGHERLGVLTQRQQEGRGQDCGQNPEPREG
ncbi:hypothetical protein ACWC09_32825 [Streptomyces sp. NPDC001617]